MRGFVYTPTEALIAGMSATVSSTILGIKLYLRRFCITSIRASPGRSAAGTGLHSHSGLATLAGQRCRFRLPGAMSPDLPPHRRFWPPLSHGLVRWILSPDCSIPIVSRGVSIFPDWLSAAASGDCRAFTPVGLSSRPFHSFLPSFHFLHWPYWNHILILWLPSMAPNQSSLC